MVSDSEVVDYGVAKLSKKRCDGGCDMRSGSLIFNSVSLVWFRSPMHNTSIEATGDALA